jgi:hypothetical protein
VILPDWPGCGRSGGVPHETLDSATVCRGLGAVIKLGQALKVAESNRDSGSRKPENRSGSDR